jgi:hypothetical protein
MGVKESLKCRTTVVTCPALSEIDTVSVAPSAARSTAPGKGTLNTPPLAGLRPAAKL